MGRKIIHPMAQQFIDFGTTTRTWAKWIAGAAFLQLGWFSHCYIEKGHDVAALKAAKASGAATFAALLAFAFATSLPQVAKEAYAKNRSHPHWRQVTAQTSGSVCCGMTAAMIGWMLLLACLPLLHVGDYLPG